MKKIAYSFVLWFAACAFGFVQPMQAQLYKDPSYTAEERAADLLKRMTLEEKIAQIRHIHSWDVFDGQRLDTERMRSFVGDCCWGFVEGFPLTGESCHNNMNRIQKYMVDSTRLGIPVFTVAEALHGSVHEGSTIFPQNIALASTFNPNLAYRRAHAIAGELHYEGIRQILAPCIDVVRDIRWGRVEETFGEDPFLNAAFACEEVRGYLDNGISPMLKHFGAHGNPMGGLNLASVNCGVGELHDVYLYPFRKVITTLPVQAVMSTYNSWNRVPNSSSRYLLTDVLRDKWGFKGYVYSDWGAIDMLYTFQRTASSQAEAAVQALSAGLDVEASSECYPKLIGLVKEGKFDVRLIDEAVHRVLLAKFRAGLFEDPYSKRYASSVQLRSVANASLAREIAEESAVLLKNDNHLLPLNLSQLGSVAVIGPNADQVQFGDYSWSRSNKDGITPLSAIRSMADEHGVKVRYARGCNLMTTDTSHIAEAVSAAKMSDVAIVFCGSASASLARDYGGANCGEGFDLSSLSLTGAQSDVAGKAVPQLYVRDMYSSVATPVKQLKAFNKVYLQPGERARVALHFAVADLAFTDEKGDSRVEPGDFELQVGESSDSILLRDTINIGGMSVDKTEQMVQTVAVKTKGRIIKITGVVRDVQATPIEGVEVYSVGTKRVVALTAKSGKYTAEVTSDDVLIFRRSGLIDESLQVDGRKAINVKMRNK